MTSAFKFVIDKEANFSYWTQLLVGKWGWYFEENNANIFREEHGPFSDEEQKALEKFKSILQKEKNQYYWLWSRYDGLSFKNPQEQKEYSFIKDVLGKRFNLLWDNELPSLKKWADILKQYNFQKLIQVLQKIAMFLGVNNGIVFPVRVKLLISGDFPTGATRSDFRDLMTLNVSRVSTSQKHRVIGVIVHEFVHIINNRRKLITKFMENTSLPTLIIEPERGYRWKYLVTETILTSIASQRSNTFVGKFLDFSELEKRNDEEGLKHKKPLGAYSYEFFIRVAASRVLPETSRYLDAGKVIDTPYTEHVIKILTKLLKERKAGFSTI
ncbi:MAG: hypothetical protein KJI72_02640 [Patescibacteria group bacterium]|nr:hypothetical protein [Patescibacteria group bacterium]